MLAERFKDWVFISLRVLCSILGPLFKQTFDGGGGAAAAALRKPCPVAGHHGNGTAEFRGRRAARPDPRPASARPPAGRAAEEPQEPRAAPAPARRPRPAPLAGPAWRRPEPPETPHPSRLRPAPEVRRGAWK